MRIPVDTYSRSVVRLTATMPKKRWEYHQWYHTSRTTTVTAITTRRGGSILVERDEEEEGVVVILGATGTGKSKLSIDIGRRFLSEVLNSDKMQVYRGFDITTNKMAVAERSDIPHHLIGELDSADGELPPLGFRSIASKRIAVIRARRQLPIVAGGSNSFTHALLTKRYDPNVDPFRWSDGVNDNGGLNYRCCLLWVEVEWEVLAAQLGRRVEEMVSMGMVEELAANFDRRRAEVGVYKGIEKAIGVPEFDKFFLNYSPEKWVQSRTTTVNAKMREAYEAAIEEVRKNTRTLAARQVEKIKRLGAMNGWDLRRLDATEAVRRSLEGRRKEEVEAAWERDVVFPALTEVRRLAGSCTSERFDNQRRWWWSSPVLNLAAAEAH